MAWGEEFGWEGRGTRAAGDRAKAAFVAHLVSMVTGVAAQSILAGPRGPGPVADARAMAIYLVHVGFALPQGRVAAAFQRDRTTVSHACTKVEKMRERAEIDRVLSGMETCVQHAPAERPA